MRQQALHTPSSRLFSMSTPSALIQIVANATGIVLDLQATNYDSTGAQHKCQAVAKIDLDHAMRFEAVLQDAINAAWDIDDPLTERNDPRQTALWSNNVHTLPLRKTA